MPSVDAGSPVPVELQYWKQPVRELLYVASSPPQQLFIAVVRLLLEFVMVVLL
jgi:hypothetical protein